MNEYNIVTKPEKDGDIILGQHNNIPDGSAQAITIKETLDYVPANKRDFILQQIVQKLMYGGTIKIEGTDYRTIGNSIAYGHLEDKNIQTAIYGEGKRSMVDLTYNKLALQELGLQITYANIVGLNYIIEAKRPNANG